MRVDGIIFDKDGTLMDFDAFWVTVSVKAMEDVLRQLGREDIPVSKFLEAFGVKDGVTDINSVLCRGTYAQMGQLVQTVLSQCGCDAEPDAVTALVEAAYSRNADAGAIQPTCPELSEVLAALKQRNIQLALVTTDNPEITHKCLRALGIEALFDKIYTDDGKTPQKPDPYCADDFARRIGAPKERLVMVGDTMTDMKFAKNAGITAVGVAKTDQNKVILAPFADVVVTSLAQLAEVLGNLVWE